MTRKYGKDGSIDTDVAVLDSNGEPPFTPGLTGSWADELVGSDGVYRYLSGGSASGRGVGNIFDAMLNSTGPGFTILSLLRAIKPDWTQAVKKGTSGSTAGFWVSFSPQNNTNGLYTRVDRTTGANTGHALVQGRLAQDLNWHWHRVSIKGADVTQTVDGVTSTTASANSNSLENTNNFVAIAGSANSVAATLIYNRVLTDDEVASIMLGKVKPTSVSGLQGYYKFNETHGLAAGQCTDYSGAGNHLTYSGAVWAQHVVGGNQNACTQSNTFSGWTIADATPADAAGEQVLSLQAKKLSEAATTAIHGVYKNFTLSSAGKPVTYSVYAKAGTRNRLCLRNYDSVNYNAYFDLIAGTIGTVDAGWTAAIQNIGNGWFRCSATKLVSSANDPTIVIAVADVDGVNSYAGSTDKFIYVMGGQIEISRTVSSYLPTFTTAQLTNNASSFPYVKPPLRNQANWWERTPIAIASADAMGSAGITTGNIAVPANATSASAFAPQADFTIATWIKPLKVIETISAFWGFAGGAYSGVNLLVFLQSANFNRIRVTLGNGTTKQDIDVNMGASAKRIPFNAWSFLVAKRIGNEIHVYINGIFVGSAAFTPSVAISTSGAHFLNSALLLTRSVRLFHRAISAAEVEQLYRTDSISDRTGLVGEWMMNDVWDNKCSNTGSGGAALNSGTFTGGKFLDSPYAMPRMKRRGKQIKASLGSKAISSNAGILPAITGLGIVTLISWVNWQSRNPSGQSYRVVGLKNAATTKYFASIYLASNGAISSEYMLNEGLTQRYTNASIGVSAQAISAGWKLIAAEIDYTTRAVTYYLNGIKVWSISVGSVGDEGLVAPTTCEIEVANRFPTSGPPVMVDDVRIYNRALTPAEHYQLFLDNAPRDGLLVEYGFDNDVEGTSVIDTSGNNFHGTPTGISAANYVKAY